MTHEIEVIPPTAQRPIYAVPMIQGPPGPRGPVGPAANFGGLPTPDLIDITGETHFYYGWEVVNTEWLIRKQRRSDALILDATPGINSNMTFAAAWASRTTLNYQ